MSGPLRIGGRSMLADGGSAIWSVAEGRRGRRWRSVTSRDGVQDLAVLLETTADGRPVRLEVAGAAGLLTLHPGQDGQTLHGNTVTTAGVRHHELPWGSDHLVLVERAPLSEAAAVGPLASRLGVGDGAWFGAVSIDAALVPRLGQVLIVRIDEDTFAITMPTSGDERRIAIDRDGLPTGGAATTWLLEID